MHILSIDQFNEKLTATSISLSDLKSVKIDKTKKPSVMESRLTNALSHLIDGYAYTFDQKGIVNGGSSESIIDNPDVTIDIDDDTKTIYLENKCHVWSMTLAQLDRFTTSGYGYSLKFGDDDTIQIRSGGQSAKAHTSKYVNFYDALSPLNKLREINFHNIEFNNIYDIARLTKKCYIDTISFVWCTFDDNTIYDSETILPYSINSNINLTSINKVLSNKLKKSGWKIN